MNKPNKRIVLPIIFAFILLNGILIIFKSFIEKHGFDSDFLIIANLFFFTLSVAGFFLQRRGLQSENPNVFVRGVYSAIMLKLLVCIVAVTIYAFIIKEKINKAAIFFSMGLYIVYTAVEVAALMKVARGKSNAEKGITT